MKRNPSAPRAPSPTPTAFSGISAYKNDSYRPIKGSGNGMLSSSAPAVPSLDPRIVARTHFDELRRYLSAYLAKAPANSRTTARAKLTRLTKQQFQELSTDVYDELVRRKKNSDEKEAVPFLPVRDDFHPKRNQARQKLATLPTSRFEDLSSDVYYELARRYPEFLEESGEEPMPSPNSAYDDVPSPNFLGSTTSPPPPPQYQPAPQLSQSPPLRISDDRERAPPDSGYGGSVAAGRRPSEDMYGRSGDDSNFSLSNPFARRKASDDEYSSRRSEEAYGGVTRTSEDSESPFGARRKQSQDTPPPRRSDERDRRPPSNSDNNSAGGANTGMATSGMIIPNKSTIAEEDIEVPYGQQLPSGNRDTVSGMSAVGRDGEDTDGEDLRSPKLGLGGLNGLSARLRGASIDDEDERGVVAGTRSGGEDYYDKMSLGRTSVGSDRSAGAPVAGLRIGGSKVDDTEKMRRDYEYKLATMQSRIAGLERDLGGAADEREARSEMQREEREKGESKMKEGEERARMMGEELNELRRRAEEQSATMRTLQKELDELRGQRSRDAQRARADEEELNVLRVKCERLENGGGSLGGFQADTDGVDQLRNDMESLLQELSELSRQNDELLSAKDNDMLVIRDLDYQVKEYKRKYEQAKTELRSVKATSQLFLQAPKSDDQLPVSPDGGILDIHVTSFLSGIDSLLTAGRSNAPSRVLTPMKAIVNAVAAIIEDVKTFERRPQRKVDMEALKSLRERAEATLSNLVAASKTHATSSGMAPVSLLDAAASHVSATITEIGRTVNIRKATRAEQDDFASSFNTHTSSSTSATNGYSPTLRPVDEGKQSPSSSPSHQKKTSTASRRMDSFAYPQGTSRFAPESKGPLSSSTNGSPMARDDMRNRLASEPSSSDTNSPPPIFDQPPSMGIVSDDSANAEGSEDAWAELKPYLEAQTESIVYAIQSVLSGVRSPTPSPTLNENLTQIITIVSSIVAVCNDNLPPASAQQGNEILRELSDHANKLSEVQSMPEVTKESRQIMAKSSFAVANAMKGLMKL